MKKIYLKETDEEVQFGDVLGLTCIKEIEDGKVTVEKDVEVTEESVDMLVGMGILEVQEACDSDSQNCPLIDFGDDCTFEEAWNSLLEKVEEQDRKLEELFTWRKIFAERVDGHSTSIKALQGNVLNLHKQLKKQTAKPVEVK